MKTIFTSKLFICMLTFPLFSYGQTDSIDYFGQNPPGKTVTKFAPGIISTTNIQDYYVSFSPNGKEMFYGNGNNERKHAEYFDGAWQNFIDYVAPDGYKSAVYSPVEGIIYVWEGAEGKLGYMTKDSSGLTDVQEVAGPGTKAWPSATTDSLIYYLGANFTVYCSKFNGTTHEIPKALPFPINNTSRFNANDICVSIEGDYLVFINDTYSAGASAGSGMFVSFKKDENHWTNPKLVSDYYLNTSPIPYFGQRTKMSPDGKYLFAANYPQNNDMDIYWVSTSIFEDARNSNFVPYIRYSIPDQTDSIGKVYSYTIPDSTFIDDDGNNTLTYTATLSNGSVLPDSLKFNSETNTISGKLIKVVSFNIKITATDTAGASISDIFRLTVKEENKPPYLTYSIKDTILYTKTHFDFTLPDTLFKDDNVLDKLSLSVQLESGESLPSWLNYNSYQKKFSGTLRYVDSISIVVTATDLSGASVSDTFSIIVQPTPTDIDINSESKNIRVFPNPANQTIQISSDVLIENYLVYQFFDVSGKIVIQGIVDASTIDVSALSKGVYLLNLKTDKGILSKKIVIE